MPDPQGGSVILTKALIESQAGVLERQPSVGWTRRQLAAIGVSWPPPKGWKSSTIGMAITPDQWEEFKRQPGEA